MAGMWLPHWCMLGMTILLLLAEVAVSRLCTSLITLVDGFHTLFILMLMALPQSGISNTSTPSTLQSSFKPSITTETLSSASPQVNHGHILSGAEVLPAEPNCGLFFPDRRIHTVGLFFSALLFTSLCTSYLMEIVSFCLEPHPVRYPLVLVLLGAAGVLHKMLMFGLNWDWLHDGRARGGKQLKAEPQFQVFPEEGSMSGKEDAGSPPQSSLHSEAVVFCNMGAADVPDGHVQNSHQQQQQQQQQPEIYPQDQEAELRENKEIAEGKALLYQKLNETPAIPTVEDSQDASEPSALWRSEPTKGPTAGDQKSVRLLSIVFIIQGLFTSVMALMNSLVMLLVAPLFPHSSEAWSPLTYLDPALSILAVTTLIATTFPQVYSYSMLLLQATPPHICVSDVGRRIVSVPGVQAVHDLHIWQLTESIVVASVHVHCYAGFPVERCADVTTGVSKVLQSLGVTCCTVQPEFVSSSCSGGDLSAPVICREDPSPPPALTCSLACGKACATSMCCSTSKEELQGTVAPPAGESKEEPHTLVIENTFL